MPYIGHLVWEANNTKTPLFKPDRFRFKEGPDWSYRYLGRSKSTTPIHKSYKWAQRPESVRQQPKHGLSYQFVQHLENIKNKSEKAFEILFVWPEITQQPQ